MNTRLTRPHARVFVASCLALATLLPAALPAHAQDRPMPPLLTVQGNGVVAARPDAMNLNVAVETDGKTLEAARVANAQAMQNVLSRLKALNIPKLVLTTTGFNAYPIHENEQPSPTATRRPPKVAFYRVHNEVQAKVEGVDPDTLAATASRIVDTAIGAGATQSNGPNFYLSQNNAAQAEALSLAVRQARQQAGTIAQAAGVRLGSLYSIESYAQPVPMRASMMGAPEARSMKADVVTPMEAGAFDVTANVTMRYLITP